MLGGVKKKKGEKKRGKGWWGYYHGAGGCKMQKEEKRVNKFTYSFKSSQWGRGFILLFLFYFI
jgi:hypothetical protein